MKLLVNGSSGFIGARTTEMLLDDGRRGPHHGRDALDLSRHPAS